ncbi:hypothetical protein PSECIP111951_04192 [Pseudoalteromonas holothuriae]|uniref:Uncharacterized protein n=1 Tax=Pseudoalteromonas holothuriae TaxID=2963714 RepID=A0ABN8US47_9GAMM|nr:hypothetical protein [Pseudoalteromonas sp. CIP111951]CAH9068557.1 hypothetical protein PSECIP111951_04192 [Pseudoalteromonas sp. CIP111951]
MTIPREISAFSSFVEYEELKISLNSSTDFIEIEVEEPYSPVGLEEKWFLDKATGIKWRLVKPDPPFGGIWSKT